MMMCVSVVVLLVRMLAGIGMVSSILCRGAGAACGTVVRDLIMGSLIVVAASALTARAWLAPGRYRFRAIAKPGRDHIWTPSMA
jgi:hypothetical protein